eukprot:CAMPEP_0201492902 /NCGR_PEP_ID=MMETSP0151_2-20130828/35249_1 /ASSEMBLY_ACC=CAM_ASM_000257 /TAXON_ID=200890 /ORGANISM="Paramoeba atlantica, Strain 621/1 / CCAP 1560/9" /LENGTH=359 /DNA_ID=CAMNT_0047879981 /DNA_START=38 /DNA_END=1117 /DNA_ORIENTATION=+
MSDNSPSLVKVATGVVAVVAAGALLYYISRPSPPRAIAPPRKEEEKHEEMTGEMTISGISVYPIKSCAAMNVQEWQIDGKGLLYDRRWMVVAETVNGDGQHPLVSQRSNPSLSQVHPQLEINEKGVVLTLHMKGKSPIIVPDVGAQEPGLNVTVWGDSHMAIDCGNEVAKWLSDAAGKEVRLAFSPEAMKRPIGENQFVSHLQPEEFKDEVWFADAFPYLLLTEEFVEWCNKGVQQEAPQITIRGNRFRPNVLVKGSRSYDDADTWHRVAIGDGEKPVVLECVKPCTRCTMPNIDQETATKSHEPKKFLDKTRKALVDNSFENCVGQNAVQIGEIGGVLRVGDVIRVLARKQQGLQLKV